VKVHFIAVSQNAKTGPIPVSIIERASCWPGCALYENGCYAETGALAMHWDRVSHGPTGGSWSEFCAKIAAASSRGRCSNHRVMITLMQSERKVMERGRCCFAAWRFAATLWLLTGPGNASPLTLVGDVANPAAGRTPGSVLTAAAVVAASPQPPSCSAPGMESTSIVRNDSRREISLLVPRSSIIPSDIAVLINDGDQQSIVAGQYFQLRHAIPTLI
jgi:hypothetical protein